MARQAPAQAISHLWRGYLRRRIYSEGVRYCCNSHLIPVPRRLYRGLILHLGYGGKTWGRRWEHCAILIRAGFRDVGQEDRNLCSNYCVRISASP